MQISTRGRYAVTAMIDLALHQNRELISLGEIARTQEISLSYLEQLFSKLRHYGIVYGVRGPGGGYRLGREASDISIADIINAVNEKLDATRCSGHENCKGGTKCIAHNLWYKLSEKIYSFLHDISLADIISSDEIKKISKEQDKSTNRNCKVGKVIEALKRT